MLLLKPNCESCDRDLAPNSTEALICSYECTFCASCVKNILNDVCPNCGGGFTARPIRPENEYRSGVSLKSQPASTKRVNAQYSQQEITDFSATIKDIEPSTR
ncbi:MAG: DUF1272 domain-containing protein [Kangiellaceae bacterium]|nr:DUF1272 domain-containing protein [Kangiellaceae bacterium]